MADEKETASPDFTLLTSHVVAAYVAKNHIQAGELPTLIASVHQALNQAATGTRKEEPAKPEPVVPINKSVRPDHIVCLFDGKKFKSLKRHLKTSHNMTPNQYRQTFGLPPDYPIVAQAYAAKRSELAKALGLGLGQMRRKLSEKAATKPATTSKAGRSKKG